MKLRYLSVVLLLACGEPQAPAPPSGEAVATYDDGAITLPELESGMATARTPGCLAARRSPGGGSLELLLPCYREVAEALTLERLVLAEVPDVDGAIAGLERHDELRRHAFVERYLLRLRQEIEIADDEIEQHYEENRERFRRPAQLTLWNLFRRHQDPARPEDTIELLRGLKERFEAGETFAALAKEHSQSETRLRDGLVGGVTEGQLPARLEEVAFALDEGKVSDPVRVRGGAVLLLARNRIEGADLTLDEVRQRIRQELTGRRAQEAITERVAGRKPPPGSTVLEPEELIAALDAGEPERVVLEIGGDPLTAGPLRQLAGLGPAGRTADLDDEGRERLAELYRRQQERRLLAIDLLESADPELRREAEEHLREEGIDAVVDEQVREEVERLVEAEPDVLQRYFEDNRHHYQSPLRFALATWDLPFGDDPPGQLKRMEELRESLAAGELDLAAAAASLGGTVEDLGWREFDSLVEEVPEKAMTYLLEIGASGFTVPYQQDDALHLLRLEVRDEPRPLEYEEAREQVRADYLARFQQELYRRGLDRWLAGAGFVFDEDAVRRLLAA